MSMVGPEKEGQRAEAGPDFWKGESLGLLVPTVHLCHHGCRRCGSCLVPPEHFRVFTCLGLGLHSCRPASRNATTRAQLRKLAGSKCFQGVSGFSKALHKCCRPIRMFSDVFRIQRETHIPTAKIYRFSSVK